MKISFTGSRNGMTPKQQKAVQRLFSELGITTLIHGDCLGADAIAHDIATELGTQIHIKIKPANIPKMRAYKGMPAEEPASPLKRNKAIVLDGDVLVATPCQNTEVTRSGTWATVRLARKFNKDVYIVKLDGSIEHQTNNG